MWHISSFNPNTHEIEMKHSQGESIKFSIPQEHQVSKEAKLAYIKSKSDSHVFSQPMSLQTIPESQPISLQTAPKRSLFYRLLKVLHVV